MKCFSGETFHKNDTNELTQHYFELYSLLVVEAFVKQLFLRCLCLALHDTLLMLWKNDRLSLKKNWEEATTSLVPNSSWKKKALVFQETTMIEHSQEWFKGDSGLGLTQGSAEQGS